MAEPGPGPEPEPEPEPEALSWLQEVEAAFGSLKRTGDAGIPIEPFLVACEKIPVVYDSLFSGPVPGILKGDIGNSIKTVRDANEKAPAESVQALVSAEIAARGLETCRKDKKTATIGALWLYRAVSFLLTLLSKINEGPERVPSECGAETYEECLRQYHGWMTSKVVGGSCHHDRSCRAVLTSAQILLLPADFAGVVTSPF